MDFGNYICDREGPNILMKTTTTGVMVMIKKHLFTFSSENLDREPD